jgi:hypothetical protein
MKLSGGKADAKELPRRIRAALGLPDA